MTSSITSQVASALIAQGKTAVEAELARIEADISNALTKGRAEAATLASQLAVHLDSHSAEVATAAALISRTAAIAGVTTDPAKPAGPVVSLTKPGIFTKALTWIKSNGWKGYVLLGLGILVLHYVWSHKII